LIGNPAAKTVQVVVQRQFEHGGAVQLALPGKVFEPFKEVGSAAEGNHVKSGHTCSMPALLLFYKESYVRFL
jgi:hypothetical protein